MTPPRQKQLTALSTMAQNTKIKASKRLDPGTQAGIQVPVLTLVSVMISLGGISSTKNELGERRVKPFFCYDSDFGWGTR